MAIIANVTFSKKVPAETEYSSQGYSLSLQTEIAETDPAAIRSRLHETFELVKTQVEAELAKGNGRAAAASDASSHATPIRNGDSRASNRQVKFLTDLASRRGIGIADLNAQIQNRFGVPGLYDLSRRDASALLDELNGQRKAA